MAIFYPQIQCLLVRLGGTTTSKSKYSNNPLTTIYILCIWGKLISLLNHLLFIRSAKASNLVVIPASPECSSMVNSRTGFWHNFYGNELLSSELWHLGLTTKGTNQNYPSNIFFFSKIKCTS